MLQRIYGTAFADKAALEEHLALHRGSEEARPPRARARSSTSSRSTRSRRGSRSSTRRARSSTTRSSRTCASSTSATATTRSSRRRSTRRSSARPRATTRTTARTCSSWRWTSDEYGVKPMNCPGHCLSLRTAASGRTATCRSGWRTSAGCTAPSARARCTASPACASFAQDDAHIFCTPEQIDDEIAQLPRDDSRGLRRRSASPTSRSLSTRPEKSLGTPTSCGTRAESGAPTACSSAGLRRSRSTPGDGAFYGPKIEFNVRDALKRSWTLATIQIDCAHAGALRPQLRRPDGSRGAGR